MTHKLIKTDNYLLVVDDSEIKEGDWMYGFVNNNTFQANKLSHLYINSKKIIAHLPLNGSPILEGVDLLPPLEDDIEQLAKEWYDTEVFSSSHIADINSFKEGYNKAREKYKYTDEDVRKAITMARDLEDWQDLVWEYEYDDIIQSLHQYPTEFECEMEWVRDKPYDEVYKVAKTITTAQGVQWVGKYK